MKLQTVKLPASLGKLKQLFTESEQQENLNRHIIHFSVKE